jgi:hypothetical protein
LHAGAADADRDRNRHRSRQRRRCGRAHRPPRPLRLCLGGRRYPEQVRREDRDHSNAADGAVGLFSPAISSSRSDRYSLAAELFPTRALGIRVSYAGFDGEDTTDAGYDLAASWFFRRNIGARLVLSRTKSALQLGDVDAVGLQLMGRL